MCTKVSTGRFVTVASPSRARFGLEGVCLCGAVRGKRSDKEIRGASQREHHHQTYTCPRILCHHSNSYPPPTARLWNLKRRRPAGGCRQARTLRVPLRRDLQLAHSQLGHIPLPVPRPTSIPRPPCWLRGLVPGGQLNFQLTHPHGAPLTHHSGEPSCLRLCATLLRPLRPLLQLLHWPLLLWRAP